MNSREGVTREIMEEAIEKHAIDVVLTGGLSFQYPAIREILQAAKEVDPRIVTVAGGGIITSAPAAGMEVLCLPSRSRFIRRFRASRTSSTFLTS